MIGSIAIGVFCASYVFIGAYISFKMARIDIRRGERFAMTYVLAFFCWPLTLMTFGALWLNELENSTR